MLKTCTKCLIQKDENQFRWTNKAKGKRTTWCKPCFSIYERAKWKSSPERRKSNRVAQKSRRIRNAQFVWDFLKQKSCMDCSENETVILEFDHRDRSTKSFNVSDVIRQGLSLQKIEDEIAKCDVVCGNCHKRRTAIQMNYYADIVR